MAKIKRTKVKNRVPFKQKFNNLMHNKKFWWIFAPITTLVIAAAILIPVLICCLSTTDEIPDYFAGESSNLSMVYKDSEGNDKTVKFQKMSYDGVKMVHNLKDDLHIFTVGIDLSTFFPDSAINDGKDTDDADYKDPITVIAQDKKLFDMLVKFQGAVDEYNKNSGSEVVAFYIVDTSKTENIGLATDTLFVSDENNQAVDLFSYMDIDGLHTSYTVGKTGAEQEKAICTTGKPDMIATVLNNAMTFMTKYDFNLKNN